MNEREQFEAWHRSHFGWMECQYLPSGEYANGTIQQRYEVWQAARATPAQPMSELHSAIMNLTHGRLGGYSTAQSSAYRTGHRDARHAAAELVAEHEAATPASAVPVDGRRIAHLESLVNAYGPKSLQYDIEHPNDGLNSSDPAEVERTMRGTATTSPEIDVSAPSPSSVGDAIRALPLPEDKFCSWMLDGKVVNAFSHGVGDPAKWDRDGYFAAKGYSRAPLYTGAQVSALLSEAAALAEQVQGQQVPEGWKLVPVEPTDAMKWEAEEIEVGNALWDGSQSTCSSSEAEKIYKAMLAAAPSTEDGQKSEGA